MRKQGAREKGGYCCPHCADTKYPCVNMERQMKSHASEEPEPEEPEPEQEEEE